MNNDLLKKLREETGVSVALIRKALMEAGDDESKARATLTKLGADAAAKKESRETNAGRIEAYIHGGSRVGVLLELRSETDFVSRNEEFAKLAHEIAMHIAAMNPASVQELIAQPFIKDPARTITDLISAASASFGERIVVGQFVRYEL
ncbi:MAG: elongation factor Ts [Candidatus Ryanbacteria bacterium]|nr:elongation factor Ts [Candidatus Ryanbacteria bacterium]